MLWVADLFTLSQEAPAGSAQSGGQRFTCLVLCSSIEGPQVESEEGSSASDDEVYGPKPQPPEKELSSEEIKPTAVGTHEKRGKMPTATEILDGIFHNYDYKLRPGIGGE